MADKDPRDHPINNLRRGPPHPPPHVPALGIPPPAPPPVPYGFPPAPPAEADHAMPPSHHPRAHPAHDPALEDVFLSRQSSFPAARGRPQHGPVGFIPKPPVVPSHGPLGGGRAGGVHGAYGEEFGGPGGPPPGPHHREGEQNSFRPYQGDRVPPHSLPAQGFQPRPNFGGGGSDPFPAIWQGLNQIESNMNRTNEFLNRLGPRLDNLEGHMVRIDEVLNTFGSRLNDLENNMGRIDEVLNTFGSRLNDLENLTVQVHEVAAVHIRLQELSNDMNEDQNRIAKLEKDVGANVDKVVKMEADLNTNVDEVKKMEGNVIATMNKVSDMTINLIPTPAKRANDGEMTAESDNNIHSTKRAKVVLPDFHKAAAFLKFLKDVDFTSTTDMEALKEKTKGSVSVELPVFEHDCAGHYKEIFFTKIGGMRNEVVATPHVNFDVLEHHVNESAEDQAAAKATGVLECVLSGKDVPTEEDNTDTIPKYFIPLGEIYRAKIHTVQTATARDRLERTNYFAFLSVPSKTIWAIYQYQTFLKGYETLKVAKIAFNFEDRLFQGGQFSDAFCLLNNLDKWESAHNMIQTPLDIKNVFGIDKKKILEPLFTVPLYRDLKATIDGKKIGDSMGGSAMGDEEETAWVW